MQHLVNRLIISLEALTTYPSKCRSAAMRETVPTTVITPAGSWSRATGSRLAGVMAPKRPLVRLYGTLNGSETRRF